MKTQTEVQPVAVIETVSKAELRACVRELKEILTEIVQILREGCDNVQPKNKLAKAAEA
jgi:hypothetical protein